MGINRGRPFSANPCLAAQYRWATDRPNGAAVYVNTSNPAPSSPYYWPLWQCGSSAVPRQHLHDGSGLRL